MSDRDKIDARMSRMKQAELRPYKIGDRVPMPKKKLVVRPTAPIDNRPSFKPARKGKR